MNDTASISCEECTRNCPADSNTDKNADGGDGEDDGVIKLKFLTHVHSSFTKPSRDRFVVRHNGNILVEYVEVPYKQLHQDIVNEAQSQVGLYDGYLTPSSVSGSIVEHQGWADLKPFIQETTERAADWADILVVWRKLLAQYEDQIIMYPVDSDLFLLYFRKDILEHFNLTVPRTWDEYNQVAAATHGQVYENRTLYGSCIGRVAQCANHYWFNMVLATITQTHGDSTGFLFDTHTMKPLADGEAVQQTLKWLEQQAQYGHAEEFTNCVPLNRKEMNKGVCVLSTNHGNTFDAHLFGDSIFRRDVHPESKAKLGVALTPGSTHVLDRETMKLTACTFERCPHAINYTNIGLVNHAPYLAFGGWTCAVNNYNDNERKKRLAMEFCSFVSSKEQSIQANIYNATGDKGQVIGGSPFRQSLVDPDLYVAKGYERDTTELYLQATQAALEFPNAVTDIRFPTSPAIYDVLSDETGAYLNLTVVAARGGGISNKDLSAQRLQVADNILTQIKDIISGYDSSSSNRRTILESYQRLRGVYTVDHDYNLIPSAVLIFGYFLMAVVFLTALLFGAWSIQNRKSNIVRSSQPFFFVMICIGALILGSAILPLSVQDDKFTTQGCSMACMSIPWLLALGWTTVFSALFAKLWRINQVMKNAAKFRRVKVSEKDVMLPFAVLLTVNVILLLVWTLVDPLVWKRVTASETSSYGTCTVDSDKPEYIWKLLVSLLGVTNGVALVLSNVEAYRARNVSTEWGESKWIAMIMGSILQVVLVGIPLMVLLNDNPTASFFLSAIMLFIVSMSVLLLIFVPKIRAWYRSLKGGKRSTMKRKSPFPSANNNSWQMPQTGSQNGSLATTVRSSGSDLTTSGLKFSVASDTAQAELDQLYDKLGALKEAIAEQGMDADGLFATAGIEVEQEPSNKE